MLLELLVTWMGAKYRGMHPKSGPGRADDSLRPQRLARDIKEQEKHVTFLKKDKQNGWRRKLPA